MNPFALFDLPVDFHFDNAKLTERYLNLQKSLHPDNFAHCSAQEQRLAMQKCAEINDALQVLKDPISRADAIIAIHIGQQQDLEQKSNKDIAFLMQQMEWREQLEQIESQRDIEQLMSFYNEIEQQQQQILAQLADRLAQQQWQEAADINDKLRFIKKLIQQIERIEEQLLDF